MLDPSISLLIAQTATVSVTSSTRPAMTFFGVQLICGIAQRTGHIVLPDTISPLVSFLAIGVGASLCLAELLAQHIDSVESLLRDFAFDKVTAALAGCVAVLIFASIGLPEAQAVAQLQTGMGGAVQPFADATVTGASAAVHAEHGPIAKTLAVGVAITASTVLAQIRHVVMTALEDLTIDRWWRWLETGGVLGLLVLLPLLPLLTLVVVVVAMVTMSGVAVFMLQAQRMVDARRRLPCPSCQTPVRIEALVCPSCRIGQEPTKWLAAET